MMWSAHATILEQIRRLDPLTEHQRIVFLTTRLEFPFDSVRALEFALFRTFCVPSISGLLDRTGEFQARAQKRYDDTDLIISELMDWGYDSARGKAALRRMNQQHGRFPIANDDFLYVLSTFIYEPIRWINRFGWRRLCVQERLGMFFFWREVGRRMNIKHIFDNYDEFESFNRAYERDHFRFAECNHRVGTNTVEMFASWGPRLCKPLVRRAMYALMDEPILKAFGFPHPSTFWRWLVPSALRLRAAVARWFPARRRPCLRTALHHRTYPQGYRIEELGPPLTDQDLVPRNSF